MLQHKANIYKAQSATFHHSQNGEIYAYIDDRHHYLQEKGIVCLKEHVLRPSASISFQLQRKERCMILPIIGGIDVVQNAENLYFIHTGQVYLFPNCVSEMTLKNPYLNESIHFIEMGIDRDLNVEGIVSFDLSQKNQCVELVHCDTYHCVIGVYGVRQDACYNVYNKHTFVLIYVIYGAFEVQNRLLESRDCLYIENIACVEYEALSENSIILIISSS